MDDVKPLKCDARLDILSFGYQTIGADPYEDCEEVLESWKPNLIFTGDNPEFPIDIFVEVMERKYHLSMRRRSLEDTCWKKKHQRLCLRILKQHIPTDTKSPSSLWKKQFLQNNNKWKEDITWETIKKGLAEHFESLNEQKNHCFSLQQQIILFNSLLKDDQESFANYCTRVNVVTSVLEHGNVCTTRKPSEHWLKLFFLLGLEEADRSLVLQDADHLFKIKDIGALISERRQCGNNFGFKNTFDEEYLSLATDACLDSNGEKMIADKFHVHDDFLKLNDNHLNQDQPDLSKNSLCIVAEKLVRKVHNEVKRPSSEAAEKNGESKEEENKNPLFKTEGNEESSGSKIIENKLIKTNENQNSIDCEEETANSQKEQEPGINDVMLICVICNKTFSTRKLLKQHNQEIHPNNQTSKCPHCDFERPDKRSVIIHIQRTHSESKHEKPYQCLQCNKKYRFNFKLTAHQRLVHGEGGIYKCCHCPYKCDQKNRLQEHVDGIHGNKKNFKCDKCDFSTSWKRGLTTHLWTVHGLGKGKNYTCEQCGYTTKVQSLYRNHLMNLQ